MGENNLCSENLYVGNQPGSNTCMTHGRDRFTTSRARGRSGHVPHALHAPWARSLAPRAELVGEAAMFLHALSN